MKLTENEKINITGEEKINVMEKGLASLKLNFEEKLKILDAGGTKYTYSVLSRMFPKSDIDTLNISESEASGSKKHIIADAQKFDLHQKYDIIFANDLIEHIPSPDAFFECSFNHLKENGILVITTPNLACWYNRVFLLLGYSLANYSASLKHRTGNPFIRQLPNEHKSVFNFMGLNDLLKIYHFKVIYAKGFTYGATHQVSAGKFRRIRKVLNSTLPMRLKEGLMIIAKRME
ncbi:MAG: methyltransferase domain-containing protein [Nanoarchaeota archaeon]|nr:class I SAM-dependent methyltransferase [Nanoarchaeota archaeon]MBU4301063.1 class I SAM-dependent methyltransferase [Nanoarchaeota archaeon]MCG2724055.1 class I SAM-dependent methyltransferase [archaeon]